jgi:hypothetical protein
MCRDLGHRKSRDDITHRASCGWPEPIERFAQRGRTVHGGERLPPPALVDEHRRFLRRALSDQLIDRRPSEQRHVDRQYDDDRCVDQSETRVETRNRSASRWPLLRHHDIRPESIHVIDLANYDNPPSGRQ